MEQQDSTNLPHEQREEILNSFNPIIKLLLKNLPDEILDIVLDWHIKGIESINELTTSINTIIKHTKQRAKLSEYWIPDWLWPMDKEITDERWLDELENLGYKLFYKGKNADAYIIPRTNPIELLLYRTDRTSVLDVPLDLEVEWKWEIQNQQWLIWVEFAKSRWIKVANRELPGNIPSNLKARCQAVELCKPLTIEIDWEEKWIELVFRNDLTGSLYKDNYSQWKDPYGLELPEWLEEWHHFKEPIFTPTTKEKNDTPIKTSLVKEKYPEIVEKLTQLFKEFTTFALERWYVVVDTKFEMFINSQWEPVLWDEILTQESSRFIKIENYEQWKYISEDKEIARELGRKFNWKERFKELKEKDPSAKLLPVKDEVTQDSKTRIITSYKDVLDAFSNDLFSQKEKYEARWFKKRIIKTKKGDFWVWVKMNDDWFWWTILDKDENISLMNETEEGGLNWIIETINNSDKIQPQETSAKKLRNYGLNRWKKEFWKDEDENNSEIPPITPDYLTKNWYVKEIIEATQENGLSAPLEIWIKEKVNAYHFIVPCTWEDNYFLEIHHLIKKIAINEIIYYFTHFEEEEVSDEVFNRTLKIHYTDWTEWKLAISTEYPSIKISWKDKAEAKANLIAYIKSYNSNLGDKKEPEKSFIEGLLKPNQSS